MIKRQVPLLCYLAFLLMLGCGGGSTSFQGEGTVSASSGTSSPGNPAPTSATVRLESALARAVPAQVTSLRLTGFDLAGGVRFGPITRAKSRVIDFENVSLSVRRIMVEYLVDSRVVGLGSRDVTLNADQINVISDLDFRDVEAVLSSLTIEPGELTLPKGSSGRLAAVAHYEDGSVFDVTHSVNWSRSGTAVDVDDVGRVEALSVGASDVIATLGSQTATTKVIVTSASLASLRFEPSSLSLAAGTSQRLLVRGVFTDGSTLDVTEDTTLGVSDDAVVSLGSPAGTIFGRTAGQTVVRAVLLGKSTQAVVTVSAALLTRIDVTPRIVDLPKGTTQQYLATGVFTDQTTQNLTASALWVSASPDTVSVTPEGLAQGLSVGSTTVQARFGGKTGQADVNITEATLSSLTLDPVQVDLPKGLTLQFTATGLYSDNTTRDVTATAGFVSDSNFVSVNSLEERGRVTANQVGRATITATFDGREATSQVVVTPEVLERLLVSPAESELAKGLSQAFTVSGVFSDESSRDLTDQVDWIALQPQFVAVDASGLVSALSPGTSAISASLSGIEGRAAVTVIDAVQSGLRVEPDRLTLSLKETLPLTAYAVFTDGSEKAVTETFVREKISRRTPTPEPIALSHSETSISG